MHGVAFSRRRALRQPFVTEVVRTGAYANARLHELGKTFDAMPPALNATEDDAAAEVA